MNHPGPHKYFRVKLTIPRDHYIYRCMLPNCTHKIQEYMLIGRECQCWDCAQSFIINRGGKKKPICESCWNRRYGKKDEGIENLLKMVNEK